MTRLVSTNLNSNGTVMKAKAIGRFVYEQRAATVLFNIIKNCPADGLFLLPANVCPIVPLVLLKAKRKFEFVDISPETLCMDHDAIMSRWMKTSERPAGIIYVRSYGAVFDTSTIFSKIKSLSPNSLVIDDRCLCSPDFNGELLPNTDAILYSTGYAKYVDIGSGGFGLISNELPYFRSELPFSATDLDELTCSYKSCLATRESYSYKDSDWLDTTAPELDWVQYRSLVEKERDKASVLKNTINSIYSAGVPCEAQLVNEFQAWRFNIFVKDNSSVLDVIRRAGLFASSHYESLAGVFGPGDAPVAEKIQRQVVNLFNDRYFNAEKAVMLTSLLASLKLTHSGYFFK